MVLLAWIAKISSNPLVARVLVPVLSRVLSDFFERQAGKLEVRAAVKLAKTEKTVEGLREASKRLSDSTARR